jgi:hypothetical protein
MVRMRIGFSWGEMAGVLARSAAVALGAGLGPVSVILWADRGFALSAVEMGVALAIAAAGWAVALRIVGHALLPEWGRAVTMVLGLARRLRPGGGGKPADAS